MPVLPTAPRTTLTIDLGALAHNFKVMATLAGTDRLILAVVKGDAYGHGAIPVARELKRLGAHFFGVSNTYEGIRLREAGINQPIVILGGAGPGEAEEICRLRLTPALFDRGSADELSRVGCRVGRRVPVHIKLDTGMGRIGILPRQVSRFAKFIKGLPGIEVEGVMSHLADADDPESQLNSRQLEAFTGAIEELNRAGINPKVVHVANSAALMNLTASLKNLVRPGITLYGIGPTPDGGERLGLRPAMSLSSRIALLKKVPRGSTIGYGGAFIAPCEMTVASVPVGYGHGYFRAFSNRSEVLIRGRRAKVVGRICMDWTMVDVSHIPGVRVDDQVVFMGSQGEERISAWELAEIAGTIPYEIVCGFGSHLHRAYTGNGAGDAISSANLHR